ncbi:MAG: hypothetical protein HY754_14785, partial [Nitrospirae bacterium]|nr:hypothetical protein [Nitrospirota bacterium]
MGKASRKKLFSNPILHLLLIAIIGLLAYSNTFNVPFQFDDTDDIAKNNKLRDLDRFWPPAGSRWFGFLTFTLNFNLNGLNTTGYHIFNLSVHILNAILVYWFVVLTLRIHDTRYTIKNMHHASCIVHHESGQADSPIHPFMVRQAHHDTSVTLSLSKGTYLPLFVALIF